MQPISITPEELEAVLSIVTNEKAIAIVKHLFKHPTTQTNAFNDLTDKQCQNVIYSCINREIKDTGLKVVLHEGSYSFMRFGILGNERGWKIARKPIMSVGCRWVLTY